MQKLHLDAIQYYCLKHIFTDDDDVECWRDIYMKVMVQDIGTSVLIFLPRLKEMKMRSLEIFILR